MSLRTKRLNVAGALLLSSSLGLGWGCQVSKDPVSERERSACKLVKRGHGPTGKTKVRAETVVEGLEIPWAIAFLPGGDLLVTERKGPVRLVRDGALVPEPVFTVPVLAEGESGLMGIALHPDFAENGLVYLAVTAFRESGSHARIERWKVAEDLKSATFNKIILDGIPADRFHVGGRLKVGPDGMLYLSTGDAGEPSRSQDEDNLAGKLLRVGLEGEIPEDNPVEGSPVYLTGIRNSQGFDWLDDSTLILSDHGPSGDLGRRGGDEVNVAKAGDNLGWPAVWHCEPLSNFTTPLLAWEQATPPSGLAVYRGGDIPEWEGSVLVSTLGSRHLQRIVLKDREPYEVQRHEVYFEGDAPKGLGRLREAIMGPDGFLYVTTSNCDGRGTCPPEKDKIVRVRSGGSGG